MMKIREELGQLVHKVLPTPDGDSPLKRQVSRTLTIEWCLIREVRFQRELVSHIMERLKSTVQCSDTLFDIINLGLSGWYRLGIDPTETWDHLLFFKGDVNSAIQLEDRCTLEGIRLAMSVINAGFIDLLGVTLAFVFRNCTLTWHFICSRHSIECLLSHLLLLLHSV